MINLQKVGVLSLFTLMILILLTGAAFAEAQINQDELIDEQIRELDLEQLNQFVKEIDDEILSYFPELSLSNLVDDIRRGELNLNVSTILSGMAKLMFKEIFANGAILAKLVVLAVICAILHTLLEAFDQGSTAKLAYAIAYLVLVAVAIGSFTLAMAIGKEAIERMVTFMQILMPILLTLLTAMGGVASAALLHPVLILSLSLLGTIITTVVLPLIYLSAVLSIVNQISSRLQVSRLISLFKQISLGVLGLCLTVFVGVISIQGVAGAVADGVTIRTAKFMTGAFIPIVGKMFSDVLEAVIGTSILLKNAVGIIGVLIIFGLTLIPAIKIIAISFIYRLAAALIQPIDDSGVGECLQSMAGSLIMVFAAVSAVGVMFFMAVTIIVSAGNFTVMLR
ncbi:MAG: stage III sporulation protein AE [Bacillota bacterium]|nr:stage III sporulation protein AE [Bacillota bacterium]